MFFLIFKMEDVGGSLIAFGIGAIAAASATLTLCSILAFLVVPRWIGNVRGTVESIAAAITAAGRAHVAGKSDVAATEMGRATIEAAAWYANVRTRHFVSQSAIALVVAFGGIVGSALLITQNSLLKDQNLKLDYQTKLLNQQNVTAEAQRRAALTAELFDVLKDVAREVQSTQNGVLTEGLINRILVLSRAAQPYYYVRYSNPKDGEQTRAEIIKLPLSPERGQLLLGLLANRVTLKPLADAGVVFEYADLRETSLSSADLTGVSLSFADFSYAHLIRIKFERASLFNAIFRGAEVYNCSFGGHIPSGSIDFRDARLLRSKFAKSMPKALLDGAYIGKLTPQGTTDEPDGIDFSGYERQNEGLWVRLRKKTDN
ncbi:MULTISPECIES: pentapeptide repeat-containing protein [Bradyrhizobium]|uniref:pentapeptide repeat-containing protein n=1 Tax=Bradyrhizobium TaxID=374 RepID=UPI001374A242|nr:MULTISPECIES: pentapeptide repeat-containing protein [Bradyrhizobium]